MQLTEAPTVILLLFSDAAVRDQVKRPLQQQGYEILTADTAEQALYLLRRHKVTGMLLDIDVPGVDEVELVPLIMKIEPSIALIVVASVESATNAALCLQRGAMDHLLKPMDLDTTTRAVQRALQRRSMMFEDQKLSGWLREEVAIRSAELRLERANIERLSIATLEALVNALEAKNPFLRGHSARVADLSAMVAAELGRSEEEIEAVRTGGKLHDIGKIGIREDVLNKQGPLTDSEYEHVKEYVLVGSQILAPLVHLKDVISFVRHHHEKFDGSGYPDRLKGEDIPYGARIIGAVEMYDALATARPYQEKMTPEAAIARMREMIWTVLDPAVHEAIATVISRRQTLTFVEDAEAISRDRNTALRS